MLSLKGSLGVLAASCRFSHCPSHFNPSHFHGGHHFQCKRMNVICWLSVVLPVYRELYREQVVRDILPVTGKNVS